MARAAPRPSMIVTGRVCCASPPRRARLRLVETGGRSFSLYPQGAIARCVITRGDLLAVPGGQALGHVGCAGVADQRVHAFVAHQRKQIVRPLQRQLEAEVRGLQEGARRLEGGLAAAAEGLRVIV